MSVYFKDLKVIELASVLAGPSVGMFFAELGAKVVKVENKPAGGDTTRSWRLKEETPHGPSAYFCAVNYAKQYLHLDLRDAADREKLLSEIADADMVLSNYRDDTALKLGTDYDTLAKRNKSLIFVQLDGFDSHNRAAYDVVLQAETGWISMTGTDNDHLAKLPVALIDLLAGHQMKEAALLALLKRERTGQGSMVRCSLEKSSLSALANQATNYLMCGHVAQPIGTQHPNIAPYGDTFTTADQRMVVLAVGSDAQFQKFCAVLLIDGLVNDDRFATNTARVLHREALVAILAHLLQKRTLEQLQAAFDSEGIPYGVVKPLDEVLASATAQSMVLKDNIDGREARRLSGIAFTTDFLGT